MSLFSSKIKVTAAVWSIVGLIPVNVVAAQLENNENVSQAVNEEGNADRKESFEGIEVSLEGTGVSSECIESSLEGTEVSSKCIESSLEDTEISLEGMAVSSGTVETDLEDDDLNTGYAAQLTREHETDVNATATAAPYVFDGETVIEPGSKSQPIEIADSIENGIEESVEENAAFFEVLKVHLPNMEEIQGNPELMMELDEEKRYVQELREGQSIELDHIEELSVMYPELLEEKHIAYAIPLGETSQNVKLVVYQKDGMNYSLVLRSEDADSEWKIQQFEEHVRSGEILPLPERSPSSIQQVGAVISFSDTFTGTYHEAGFDRPGAKGSYKTTFYIEGRIMTGGDMDLYNVCGEHYITPYAGTAMATTRYSYGIAPYGSYMEVISGAPNTSLKEAKEYSYSIGISYPVSIGFSFGWNGSVGTKIQAGIRPQMHDVIFTNPSGVFGEMDNGTFQYDTTTLMTCEKNKTFKFQFNEVIFNSVYVNQTGMVKHGDYWQVVVPAIGTDTGGTGNYTYGGLDYSPVFDAQYYLNKYPDLAAAFGSDYAAAFIHFIQNGMAEGRQGSSSFNVTIYKNRYSDLQQAFGNDLKQYYLHYIQYGRSEGRSGI